LLVAVGSVRPAPASPAWVLQLALLLMGSGVAALADLGDGAFGMIANHIRAVPEAFDEPAAFTVDPYSAWLHQPASRLYPVVTLGVLRSLKVLCGDAYSVYKRHATTFHLPPDFVLRRGSAHDITNLPFGRLVTAVSSTTSAVARFVVTDGGASSGVDPLPQPPLKRQCVGRGTASEHDSDSSSSLVRSDDDADGGDPSSGDDSAGSEAAGSRRRRTGNPRSLAMNLKSLSKWYAAPMRVRPVRVAVSCFEGLGLGGLGLGGLTVLRLWCFRFQGLGIWGFGDLAFVSGSGAG
jgi:hypothetical protein